MAEFIWQASAGTPGQTVPVTVRGKGRRPCRSPAGVDERKPLFTIWVAPAGQDG